MSNQEFDADNSEFQKQMKAAFDSLQESGFFDNFVNEAEYLNKLPEKQRFAYLLGRMNYQVNNGGWMQWVDNGYAVRFDMVVNALQTINGEKSQAVLEMLGKLAPHISYGDGYDPKGFVGGDYRIVETDTYEETYYEEEIVGYDEDDEPVYEEMLYTEYYDEETCDGWDIAETLNKPFWDISDEWLHEVEKWMKS